MHVKNRLVMFVATLALTTQLTHAAVLLSDNEREALARSVFLSHVDKFTTEQFVIRPVTKEDIDKDWKLPEKVAEDTKQQLALYVARRQNNLRAPWIVVKPGKEIKDGDNRKKMSDEFVGFIGLNDINFQHDRATLLYRVRNAFDSKETFNELLEAVTFFGFGLLKLNRIQTYTTPQNIMLKLWLKSAGFKHEGTLYEFFKRNTPALRMEEAGNIALEPYGDLDQFALLRKTVEDQNNEDDENNNS